MPSTTERPTPELYSQCIAGNYGQAPVELVRGQGIEVTAADGTTYLDFSSGIAVNALGHCHPRWVQAIQQQATELVHVSNLFANRRQAELGQRLCDRAGPGKVLFCNSGAEANEAAIKLARLHGRRLVSTEGRRFTVLTASNAFHGRTFGAMAATPQEKIQAGFMPMLDGFRFGNFNDLESFESLIDDGVAAILIEPVQGEGGVNIATHHFLKGLRDLCDAHGLLLIFDEVQCGAGRTGAFFAYEHSGVRPDAIAMAKGLGGGFPIGALWMAPTCCDLFQPGSHGTTYGGNPLACAAALAVLDTIEAENLLDNVRTCAPGWHEALKMFASDFPECVVQVRAIGFMVGIQLRPPIDARDVCTAARGNGLLTVPAANNVLRLLPPLIANADQLNASIDKLWAALAQCQTTNQPA